MFFLSGKQPTISPISRRPIFTKFKHNMSIGEAANPFGTEFRKFYRKGSFFPKKRKEMNLFFKRLGISGRHNSAMIIDRRKLPNDPSSFHFYRWNQFIVIPLACTLRARNLPKIFCDVQRELTARQITLTTTNLRQPVTIVYY